MKLRTQFILAMASFGVMFVLVAAFLWVTDQRRAELAKQEQLARTIEREAFELSYMGNDFLIYREGHQVARWEAKFSSVSQNLSNLKPGNAEQQQLAHNMKENQQRLGLVFVEARASVENGARARAAAPGLADLQVSWSRMEVQNQGILFDAQRLAQMIDDEAARLERTNAVLITVLSGIFGVFLLVNFLFTYRGILKSLSKLHAGIRVIGSGNLDHIVEAKRRDEIGELSLAFNWMTASLRNVTASKAELEREIDGRKKAETRLVHLASFPELNPMPVVEMDLSGHLTYINPAARRLFPDIPEAGNSHPFLGDWKTLGIPQAGGARTRIRQVKIGDLWYLQTSVYLPHNQSLRFYPGYHRG